MDFSPELLAVEEALNEFEADEGSLSDPPDNRKSLALTKLLKSKLHNFGFDLCQLNDASLRRITFFLQLNADLGLSLHELLQDDFDCGHLVNHRINGRLLFETICRLSLQKYFCETIVFCSPALGCELLTFAIESIPTLGTLDCIGIETTIALVEAIFMKMKRIETFAENIDRRFVKHIFSKLFTSFTKLLDVFKPTKSSDMHPLSNDERVANVQKLLGILKLCRVCFDFDPEALKVPLAEYLLAVEYEYSTWVVGVGIPITSHNFNQAIMSLSIESFEDISVDVWCTWSELESVTPGKSIQNVVAEEMYATMLVLKNATMQLVKSDQCEQLIAMLATMAIKPWDEDDEIKDADFETILSNVSNETMSREKWLMVLLKLDSNILAKDECLSVLEMNTEVLSSEHIDILFERILDILDIGLGSEYVERLRKLALDSVKHFSFEEQMRIMIRYFDLHGASTLLLSHEFHNSTTQVFNKAVSITSEGKREFFEVFINLCFQSPQELITKVLLEGLTSPNQTTLMVEVLKVLQPVCHYRGCSQDGKKEANSLIINLLTGILLRNIWTEQESDNFIQLVMSLLTNAIMDNQEFLASCLFPSLHQTCIEETWQMTLLFIQTLATIVTRTLPPNVIPIIAILAQVMELSRCDLTSFSQDKVLVCEEASNLVQIIIPQFLALKTDDKHMKWLNDKVSSLSSVDQSYFKHLRPSQDCETPSRHFDSVIFNLIQNEEITPSVLVQIQGSSSKRQLLVQSLVKILPKLTGKEWKALSKLKILSGVTDAENQSIFLFTVLTDAVMVLCCVVKEEFCDNLNSLQCIHHCFRSFAFLYQESILPHTASLPADQVTDMFRTSVFLLECLPAGIKEACSIFLMLVVMRQMTHAMECCQRGVGDNSGNALVEEFSTVIALSSVHKVRVALSRKLTEISSMYVK